MSHQETREYEDQRGVRLRRRLNIRRLIGVIIILLLVSGIIWFCFFSGLADPVVMAIEPFLGSAAALINDPLGIDWGGWLIGLAAIVIPAGLLLLFIFDS